MSRSEKLDFIEVREGKPRVRWGPYFLGLAIVVAVVGLLNGLLLAAGVWSGVDTVIFGLFASVVVFNVLVIAQFNRATKTAPRNPSGADNSSPSRPSPRGASPVPPPHAGYCPRCGATLTSDTVEGLCPQCLMALNVAPPTDMLADEAGASETQVAKPPPAAPLPLAEVARHFPQLEILDCLGRGGMGVVYRARQPQLNRLVALKILAPEKEKDATFSERFTREAQTLARLSHQNIVTIYDFGKVDGLFYLLMEHVDGTNLRQLLQTKQITPEAALAIVPKICAALQYAHEHGVVHRDIKPENVLLNQEGEVKIADFGIAKMVGGEPGQAALTQDAQVIGTPHDMAPEQIEHPQRVDHRADIYSLGVVFYEMLTGELPLGKFAPPSQKVQVDVRLDEVVLHALEKEPERRYQQASQVKTDVETIASKKIPTPMAVQSASSSSSDEQTCAEVQRQVKAPAIGLFIAGCLDFVMIAAVLFSKWFLDSEVAVGPFLIPVVAILFLAGVIIVGAVQMQRQTNHRLAITASLLAIIFPPGAVIGLPFGIWALIVLNRPEVRRVFALTTKVPYSSARVSALRSAEHDWNKRLAIGIAVALVIIGIPLATFLTLIALKLTGARTASPARVVAVEQKLRQEIQQRLNEAGWQPESLSISVAPDLKRAECRFGTVWKNGMYQIPFNAALILKSQGGGLWQVRGEGEFQSLRFSVDTAAEMAAGRDALPMTALAASFGPEREITLNDIDDMRGGEALDFDSGKLLDLPKDTDKRPASEQMQWFKEQSADLLLDNVNGRWGLLTPTDNELKITQLPNQRWKLAAASDLSQALAADPSGLELKLHHSWTVYVLATNAQPPLTFAFRTGSGATGLLQITRFEQAPNSARLRYKLAAFSATNSPATRNAAATMETTRQLEHALATVEQKYQGSTDRRVLTEVALSAIAGKLDAYSSFGSTQEMAIVNEEFAPQQGGVGLSVRFDKTNRQVVVVTPLPDTPGFKAGIRAGDCIVEIEGKPVSGFPADKELMTALAQLRGPPGETITVGVKRAGSETVEKIRLVRELIVLPNVKGDTRKPDGSWNFMLDDARKIGYVRLIRFGARSAQEMESALRELERQQMKALILDLREDSGGSLTQAVQIADLFLESGLIVRSQRRGASDQEWFARQAGTFSGFPMAVLVNGATAGASEVLAACLQDHQRAVIVGERTFGKGSVQSLFPLGDGKALRLTTSILYRPNGSSLHRDPDAKGVSEWGVAPNDNCTVRLSDEERKQYNVYRDQRDLFSEQGPPPSQFRDRVLQKAIEYLQAVMR